MGQFLPMKYDVESYLKSLKDKVNSLLSDKGKWICHSVLFGNVDLLSRFKEEFTLTL